MSLAAANVAGLRFGRLVAIERAGRNKAGMALWSCRCDCGGTATPTIYKLTGGHTTSCGCRQRTTRLTHGETSGRNRSPEFRAWQNMLKRCSNENHPQFKDWGGRGITVCERWRVFEPFLADMGRRPSALHSIDRIDVDGNYEPSNCRWATKDVQQHNHRPRSNTGHLVISWAQRDNRYVWRVTRRERSLGGFALDLESAIAARDAATKELYGEAA